MKILVRSFFLLSLILVGINVCGQNPVRWNNMINATYGIVKNYNVTGYNSGAISLDTLAAGVDGWIEIKVPRNGGGTANTYRAIGLSFEKTSNDMATIDYCININIGVEVRENGVKKGPNLPNNNFNSEFIYRIERIGTTIYYKTRQEPESVFTTRYTSQVPSTTSLIVDISMSGTNSASNVTSSFAQPISSSIFNWISVPPNVYMDEGNVAIGTSTISPSTKLEVVGPATGSGLTIKAGGGGDVLLNSGGSLFFDGNYSYGSGNYIRPLATNTQGFFTGGVERMRISASGKIGVGETNPQALLEIKGPYTGASQVIINSTSSNSELRFSSNGNAKGFVWYSQSNDRMAFGRGSTSNSLFISPTGEFGIGTTLNSNPNNYKLAVDGMIGAKEVKVETNSAAWPDYVFESDYKLEDLKQIESFIVENKHLPGIPSAKEVSENGFSLGDMNVMLLKKIEELTLYVIDLKKKNAAIAAEVAKIKSSRENENK